MRNYIRHHRRQSSRSVIGILQAESELGSSLTQETGSQDGVTSSEPVRRHSRRNVDDDSYLEILDSARGEPIP